MLGRLVSGDYELLLLLPSYYNIAKPEYYFKEKKNTMYLQILTCLVLSCVIPTLIQSKSTEKYVCPGFGFVRPQTPCEDSCKDDTTCKSGLKCCYSPLIKDNRPCGSHCIQPKENIPKEGQCPDSKSKPESSLWGICDIHMCDIDGDCKGKEKCCRNTCGGPVCIAPEK
ncbi:unnamed protein product [Didymodactylos carnosus]|uniref:WAP domain-containing protein n=1 Tax=Didymodactylos carnosus TaxID=1234261 RepID=A0A814S4F8_9BILA|nr:unnamed protein product [Didymodactylos carnosus]CAF1142482.1 unnamed protein product [Didymodactylos carnosus]CAF3585508.1 unnamed protein product [Didymodactylos carnosus]CAF3906132.1 unnamed protein product [Didymodactylos carnosus]